MTDASDIGVGSVLVKEDEEGIDHPLSYYSNEVKQTPKTVLHCGKGNTGLDIGFTTL